MKKLLAIILTAALLMSVCGVSAFAAENDQPAPTTGPWDGFWWMTGGPMLCFYYDGSRHYIYSRQGQSEQDPIVTDNEAVPGATYDKATNTLTISDLKLSDGDLEAHYMGDDFKLRVEGECELGFISVRNYIGYHSMSLNIIGTGALTVNGNKSHDDAMYFYGDGPSLMHLDIADSVTVHMYAKENASEQLPQHVMRIWSTYADPAITVGGKAIPEAKSERKSDTVTEQVKAVFVNDTDQEYAHGKRVKSKTDPEGIYAVKEIQYSAGNGFETRYGVIKYYYDDTFEMYLPDPEYVDEYGYAKNELTKAEFDAAYDYVLEPQPVKIRITSDDREAKRGYRGVKFIKDGEPDSVYIGLKYGWYTAYTSSLGEINNYYIHKAHWDEDEQLYVLEGSAVERSKTAEELEALGYRIATEEVMKNATMQCWQTGAPYDDNNYLGTYELLTRASDPDGLYAFLFAYKQNGVYKGVKVTPIDYDEENGVYYLRGYYGGIYGVDTFDLDYNEFMNGETEFSYKLEPVEQRMELQYVSESYDFDDYSSEALLLNKDGESGIYCYTTVNVNGNSILYIYPLEWREDKGHYYVTGDGYSIDSFDSMEAMEAAGYHEVLEAQPVDYATVGSVKLANAYTLLKDESDNSYFSAWYNGKNTAFSISESEKWTYGGVEYYIGTATEVNPSTLHYIQHEVLRDDFMWWIEGTEYHHIGSEAADMLIGDTDLDGHITIRDVTSIQRHLAEVHIFTDEQLALADTNGDGEINLNDATHLQKYLAEFDGIVLGKKT